MQTFAIAIIEDDKKTPVEMYSQPGDCYISYYNTTLPIILPFDPDKIVILLRAAFTLNLIPTISIVRQVDVKNQIEKWNLRNETDENETDEKPF